jgi:hypothetical protein
MQNFVTAGLAGMALLGLASKASAATETFDFSSSTVTAQFTLDVVGGQALSGTGSLTSPYWSGADAMTLVTLSTPDVHDLGGGNLSFRFGGGTDLIGDTTVPIDGNGLVFAVTGAPSALDVGFNIWSNGGGSYTGFVAGNAPTPGGAIIYYSDNGSLSVAAAPEASTWAMMLIGFSGLAFAATRKARKGGIAAFA